MTTIRARLTWKLLGAFALPLVAGGLAVFLTVRDSLIEQFDATLQARALALVTVTRQRTDRLEIDSSARFMRDFDAPEGAARTREDGEHDDAGDRSVFEITRPDGAVIARSASLGTAPLPAAPIGPAREASRHWNLTLPSGASGRALRHRNRAMDAA